ncbi:MAG: uncharacterized protein QOE06_3254 [Thermoleophilaceae bacterium]|jgi:uncharacterized membrane protein YfcA|nr:uncharacterized protein [Thermoleophilaceae bacterium]
MDAGSIAAAAALGFAAGMTGGMLGVGGGVIFVPTLVFVLDQSQLDALSTSLLAIIPVAMLGAWRQWGYGNLRVRDGLIVALLAPPGVILGTVLANALSERVLELSFAALQVFMAVNLVRRALRRPADA